MFATASPPLTPRCCVLCPLWSAGADIKEMLPKSFPSIYTVRGFATTLCSKCSPGAPHLLGARAVPVLRAQGASRRVVPRAPAPAPRSSPLPLSCVLGAPAGKIPLRVDAGHDHRQACHRCCQRLRPRYGVLCAGRLASKPRDEPCRAAKAHTAVPAHIFFAPRALAIATRRRLRVGHDVRHHLCRGQGNVRPAGNQAGHHPGGWWHTALDARHWQIQGDGADADRWCSTK